MEGAGFSLWGELIRAQYYLQDSYKDGAKHLLRAAGDVAGAMATNSSLGAPGQAAGQACFTLRAVHWVAQRGRVISTLAGFQASSRQSPQLP